MADLGFDGRVAVITGAGRGLGRQHALLLASRGAQIVVNDLGSSVSGEGDSSGPAQATAKEIEDLGGVAVANTDSVVTPEGGRAIVAAAMEAFGRVDIVVNNAGIIRDKAFHNMTAELVGPVLDVHIEGAFNVTGPAWARMREQGYGRVVNTASASGLFGNFGQSSYAAAKMGLVGMTRVLANEGRKYNITANAIAPIASTRMTERHMTGRQDRLGPELISPVVAYLAHEDCAVTGEIYTVAGGHVARVFIGVTQGIFEGFDLTPEAVRDKLNQIRDETGYYVPENPNDEIARVYPHL
jgi:NAD(P)-dependent dehydrogenase (short-subunit alcohol dehydrogenase family)